MIHKVLREFLDQGVVVYLDDILVYSETEEEHVKLLTKVFTYLAKYNLAVAVHKSVFHVPEVEFLGYIVNGTGISVSGETTQAICDWEVPKKPKRCSSPHRIREFLLTVHPKLLLNRSTHYRPHQKRRQMVLGTRTTKRLRHDPHSLLHSSNSKTL